MEYALVLYTPSSVDGDATSDLCVYDFDAERDRTSIDEEEP